MLLLMLAAMCLDLLSKAWAHAALLPHVRQEFITHLLNFVLVNNTGLAFSMVHENSLLAKIISSIVFIALSFLYWRRYIFSASAQENHVSQENPRMQEKHPLLEQVGVSIIIGAAAGNLLERFLYGHVTDFIEFAFISFPVFNLADVLIDIGVLLIFASLYWSNQTVR